MVQGLGSAVLRNEANPVDCGLASVVLRNEANPGGDQYSVVKELWSHGGTGKFDRGLVLEAFPRAIVFRLHATSRENAIRAFLAFLLRFCGKMWRDRSQNCSLPRASESL
jgi:hypothetical protein